MTAAKLDLETLVLDAGAHNPGDGFCIMEAVAFLAGEAWSDSPACASPVISEFLRVWNGCLDNESRQALKQYIPRLVHSRGTEWEERRRSWMVMDWYMRVQAPAWLRLAGLTEDEDAVAHMPELRGEADLMVASATVQAAADHASAARTAADSAARTAADSAAWLAADSAARLAAKLAAWSTARSGADSAAGAAARAADHAAMAAAAWTAAWSAARSAAESAAEEKRRPTVSALQRSAHALIDRLLRMTEDGSDDAA